MVTILKCDYTFSFIMTPSGIQFGAKLNEKMKSKYKFGSVYRIFKINFYVCKATKVFYKN